MVSRMRMLALASVVIAMVVIVPTGAAQAQVYPPNGCQLQASTNIVAPGDVVIVTGVNFQPGASIDLFLLSDPVYLTTVTADAAGTFTTEVIIPEGTTPGFHEIRASSGTCVANTGFTVTGPATAVGGGGSLAFTGSDSLPWVWIALVLLALGTAIVVGARRRVHAGHHSTG